MGPQVLRWGDVRMHTYRVSPSTSHVCASMWAYLQLGCAVVSVLVCGSVSL